MLELARGLSPEILSEIAALEADSVSADGGRLKLEWSVLKSRSGGDVEDVLWREDGRLVGFVGLYSFGGHAVEVAGMVHPDFRHRGIGTALLDQAIELSRARGLPKILLVTPRTSPGAPILAGSRRGFLEHSEHALDLNGAVNDGPSDPSLTLRPAVNEDISTIARILEEAFGGPWGSLDLDALGDAALVAERGGEVIATLRVHRGAEVWSVYGFAVEPQDRGKGVGRDLLRRVCRQANKAGVTRLHLEVEVNNDRALGLYTSLGFTQTATDDYYEIPL